MKMIAFNIQRQKLFFFFAVCSATALLSCRGKVENLESGVPDSVYMNAGNRIVALTFDSLRNSLAAAINSGGIEGAITFCNANALEITSRFADSFTIERTALRYRNPDNKPDSLETGVLNEMTADMQSVKIPRSRIIRDRGSIHYFKPIAMQGMCLSCHGNPRQHIPEPALNRIRQLYPQDQAVNFKEGDLRGVWHIIFKSGTK